MNKKKKTTFQQDRIFELNLFTFKIRVLKGTFLYSQFAWFIEKQEDTPCQSLFRWKWYHIPGKRFTCLQNNTRPIGHIRAAPIIKISILRKTTYLSACILIQKKVKISNEKIINNGPLCRGEVLIDIGQVVLAKVLNDFLLFHLFISP